MSRMKFLSLGLLMILMSSIVSCTKDDAKVVELTIKTPPNKTYYFEEDHRLDLTGIVVTVHYDDNSQVDVAYENFSAYKLFSYPYNGSELQEDKGYFEISYASKLSVKVPVYFSNEVVVAQSPSKSKYYLGEKLDLTGLTIAIVKDDGSKETVHFDSFQEKGIECSPDNGSVLTNLGTYIVFKLSSTGAKDSVLIETETVTDIDGNVYPLCKIGSQIWMAENLRTTHLNDGTNILKATISSSTPTLLIVSTPVYAWYNNDKSTAEGNHYGAFYNFEAVKTGLLSPKGYHVPSKDEYQQLIDYLKKNGFEKDAGLALKSTKMWYYTNGGSSVEEIGYNSFGFNAYPTGYIHAQNDGDFFSQVYFDTYFWTTTVDDATKSSVFYLSGGLDGAYTWGGWQNTNGFCIRCLKD